MGDLEKLREAQAQTRVTVGALQNIIDLFENGYEPSEEERVVLLSTLINLSEAMEPVREKLRRELQRHGRLP
jgi:hypothetical protein